MSCELLEPVLCDEDSFLLLRLVGWFEPLIVGSFEYLLHVVVLEGTHHAEKELALWQLSRQLLLGRQVLAEDRI